MKIFEKRSTLIFLVVLLVSVSAAAQKPNFSMYRYTPFFTNPAEIGVIQDVRLMLNYRNQPVENHNNFQTSSLSGYYPINIGNQRLVVGANFLNDQASGFVQANGGLLGLGYGYKLSPNAELSLGFQGGLFQRKIGSDNFTTDDQFVNGAFDPNVASSERMVHQTKGYPTLSAGLFYQLRDDLGRDKAFVGASIFNANEPDISFLGEQGDNLPRSIKASAGYRVYQGLKFSVMPTARFINQADNSFMNLGSLFGYELESSHEGIKKIELGLWYNTNELGVLSLAYEKPNMILGVSYDLFLGRELNYAKKGIFELAVSLRLKDKRKAYLPKGAAVVPTVIKEGAPPQKEEPDGEIENVQTIEEIEEEAPSVVVAEAPEEEVMEELEEKPEKLILPPEEQELLNQTVKFNFNSIDIDQESSLFLDRLASLLNNRKAVKVQLIGHSCNVGTKQVNMEMSLKRAESVKKYLTEKGIDSDRFITIGFGDSRPLGDNSTPEGRRLNRSVEILVLN